VAAALRGRAVWPARFLQIGNKREYSPPPQRIVENKPRAGETDVVPKLDASSGELRGSTGDDWVLISGEALRRVYEAEVAILGTGAFVIWYNAGKYVGKIEGKKFAKLIEELGIDQLAKELSASYAKLGWGTIEVGEVDLLRNELTITMRNSPMVRGVSDKESRCWYVRGFMEGLVSSVLGVEATAFELTCEAVNGNHCEFKTTWKPPSQLPV
jgi:predicted hydrocarbon binding protein